MAQLTKGMYGNGSRREFRTTGPFGLRCGQARGGVRKLTLTHNSGWYNRAGEKLGWGDLSTDDLLTMFGELEDDEFFIILDESDSFWRFVTRPGTIGSMATVKPGAEAPGVDYVAEHATLVIGHHQFYLVDRHGIRKENVMNMSGLVFRVLTKEAAKQLIARAPA